jgi:hypothetical protein
LAVGLFDSERLLGARRALEAEAPAQRELRQWARELWDATEALALAPGELHRARAALHHEAVARMLDELTPQSAPPAATYGALSSRPALEATLTADWTPQNGELLRDAHWRLLAELEAPLTTVAKVQARRWLVAGAVALACAATAVAVAEISQAAHRRIDLAKGKPFTLSSTWAQCHPDRNECGGVPMRVFFHTKEQLYPFIVLDLGQPTKFSRLTIRNRTDIAMMRAVPLVAEVSNDGKSFLEVARRTDSFVEWKPRLVPQTARYLRLRVDRVSYLHLEAIEVHP